MFNFFFTSYLLLLLLNRLLRSFYLLSTLFFTFFFSVYVSFLMKRYTLLMDSKAYVYIPTGNAMNTNQHYSSPPGLHT